MRNESEAGWSPGAVTAANRALLIWTVERAGKVFEEDEGHSSIAFIIRSGVVELILHLCGEDDAPPEVRMSALAMQLEKDKADAVIVIGETWSVAADELKPYERPSESDDRIEQLSVSLLQEDGGAAQFSAEIQRAGEDVWLGEWVETQEPRNLSFAPIHWLWKHPIPKEWTELMRERLREALEQRQ